MKSLNDLIHQIIALQASGRAQITLLAVCPNSQSVLEAAVKAAARNHAPLLFAATLNQVDTDGGYTGWTPAGFVRQMQAYAAQMAWSGPLYPCLDHGGPWLKDRHTLERLSLTETMQQVKHSLTACLEAGYQLLHIDPTVDRCLPPGETLPVETVVERTIELVVHAESVRQARNLPPIAYEVGTEEVHGGLGDPARFEHFLAWLKQAFTANQLQAAWPCFFVAQVGTALHTTFFDTAAASTLYTRLAPLGSLAKGHYTDWVENPADYPSSGMGGANVGPEFTAVEYQALKDLEAQETCLTTMLPTQPCGDRSHIMETLHAAVIASGRWQKWLQPAERGLDFTALAPERQEWLVQTGSRYVWAQPDIVAARQRLYANLAPCLVDPHTWVIERIAQSIERYLIHFNLRDSLSILAC